MSSAVFYDGSVADAIQQSAEKKRPLVIFLKGNDEVSLQVEEALTSNEFQFIIEQCIVLRLEDDLQDTANERYVNAQKFKQFFPVDQLPAVILLATNGTALVTMKGDVDLAELLSKLKTGADAYANSLNPTVQETAATPSARSVAMTSTQTASSTNTTAQTNNPATQPSQSVPKNPVVKKKKKKTVKPEKPPPPPVYTTAIIRIRLTNGEYIQHEFAADATLGELCNYVDIHRTDGGDPYVIETLYPRQSLGKDSFNITLKELDLVPRSAVQLAPMTMAIDEKGAPMANDSNNAGLFSSVYNSIGSVFGYLGSFSIFSSAETEQREPQKSEEMSPPRDQNTTESMHPSQQSTGIRRRSAWAGNVHGLYDRKDDDQGPSDNVFWFSRILNGGLILDEMRNL